MILTTVTSCDTIVVHMRKLALILGIVSTISVVAFMALLVMVSYKDYTQPSFRPKPVQVQTPPTSAELLKLVNQERIKAGVHPLTIETGLEQSAQYKAEDMIVSGYGHYDKRGRANGLDKLMQRASCQFGSENGGYTDTADKAIKGWLDSKSHREAMLNSRYDTTGFGIAKHEGAYYLVEHFCDK